MYSEDLFRRLMRGDTKINTSQHMELDEGQARHMIGNILAAAPVGGDTTLATKKKHMKPKAPKKMDPEDELEKSRRKELKGLENSLSQQRLKLSSSNCQMCASKHKLAKGLLKTSSALLEAAKGVRDSLEKYLHSSVSGKAKDPTFNVMTGKVSAIITKLSKEVQLCDAVST